MSRIRGPRDLWAGLLFIAFGAGTVLIATSYAVGTAARMGPGYFPRALGSVLMLLGAASVLRSFRLQGAAIESWSMRPIVVTLGSVVMFGLIVQYAGLVVSTIFLVFASSAASREFRPVEAAISSVLMALLCIGVFVYLLHIQLPILPQFR